MSVIFYGIHAKNIQDKKLMSSLSDEKYHEVFTGTVNVNANNSVVQYIFVDRIFVINVN